MFRASTSQSEMPAKRRRPGAGRHVKNEDLDDRVADWIREELSSNRLISRSQVQEKALEMYKQNKIVGGREFKVCLTLIFFGLLINLRLQYIINILRQAPDGSKNFFFDTISNHIGTPELATLVNRLPQV